MQARSNRSPSKRGAAGRASAPWARFVAVAAMAIGLGAAPSQAIWAAAPADAPAAAPEAPPAADSLQLDDPAEPFVPLKPRSAGDEDHIQALALFAAARVAEQKQDYALALRNYQRAFRFDTDALAALREIVPLAFNLDRQEEGVRYALILAERDPTDATMLRRLAIYLTESGDIQRALSLYEKAVALQERSGDKPSADTVAIWLEMARLYFVAKKFDLAARYFGKVNEALENPKQYQLTPTLEKALVNKGELTYQLFGETFLQAGRPAEALAAFEKSQAIKADEARQLYNLARVDAKNKRPAQALAKLDQYFAGRFAQQGTGPCELFVELLAEVGQADQVFDRLEKYRAADPDNMPLAFFLAERYRKAGKLEQAQPIYAAVIEKRKERPPLEAIIGLVEIYQKQKDAGKLLALLGDSVGRAGSLAPLGDAGKALLADTETAGAVVAAAKKQLADDPGKLDFGQRQLAAVLALSLGDFASAETLFEAALATENVKKAEVLENWGLQLFVANQYEQAVKVLQRGMDLPDDEKARFCFYLAAALEMSGHTDEAVEQARQAAQLQKDPRYASRVAWIQSHAKRYDASRQSYLELLEKFDKTQDPPGVREVVRDARISISNLCVLQGKVAEAEEWLERVLDEFPEDPGALNDLGYLWADAGKHPERAHEMIQVAVADDPKNMAYRDSLGWVLFRLGKYPEAVAELKVAASAPNPDGVVLDHLGDALEKNGEQAAAIDAWKRSAEAFEKSSEVEKAQAVREKLKHAESQPPAKPAETPGEKAPGEAAAPAGEKSK
ncbi:MAG: tetratricopeptide repeat protein [Pirellulales bacterium]